MGESTFTYSNHCGRKIFSVILALSVADTILAAPTAIEPSAYRHSDNYPHRFQITYD